MARYSYHLVAFIFMIVAGSIHATELLNEQEARTAVENYLKEEMFIDSSTPLRVIRREDWEDNFFNLQEHEQGNIFKALFIYQIKTTGTFVISPNKAITIVSCDGRKDWIVGVSAEDGKAYGISGFINSEQNIRSMLTRLRLKPCGEKCSVVLASLIYTFIEDPLEVMMVADKISLKHRAEYLYHSYLDEIKAEKQFRKWWKRVKKANIFNVLGITCRRSGDGHLVSQSYLDYDDNSGVVLKSYDIYISSSGSFVIKDRRILFPTIR